MAEEQTTPEATPLEPGKLSISTQASEKKELPNSVYFQTRIVELGVADFGEGPRLEVQFEIEDPAEYKGQTFKKWFNMKAAGPKAGIVKLAQAVLGGTLAEKFDPTVLKGKGVNVVFQPDTYEGKKIQVANYMPLAPGQKKVVELTDEETKSALDEIFGEE